MRLSRGRECLIHYTLFVFLCKMPWDNVCYELPLKMNKSWSWVEWCLKWCHKINPASVQKWAESGLNQLVDEVVNRFERSRFRPPQVVFTPSSYLFKPLVSAGLGWKGVRMWKGFVLEIGDIQCTWQVRIDVNLWYNKVSKISQTF